ncbi:PhzF family phenazine biosynthesis protein [Marinobacterium lutimaris]|uniref:Phenazine biosynthesis protein PhzF family n=1 Tax=Marinobacterium lutimaris TaxID=568106 RepID=A0A1H5VKZ8_9GAMM|nr:PhzF family phenazine biosynthesis protein [Marinobacterium lutimaris]SEF87939.1 phenazine biosynthesis protein PhzF family [Marinobacterium lutimaris]
MKIEVPIVNAFIDGEQGGNPAGVVINAERFTSEEKQRIAAAVGLSETAFVSPSARADFKLEFFTPSRQIAHCGHATVAAFSYLHQLGLLSTANTSKETIDGCRDIHLEGDQAYMEQLAPRYEVLSHRQREFLLESLGLSESDLLPGAEPQIVNTGNSFVVIGVKDAKTLARLAPDQRLIRELSESLELIGLYVFCLETEVAGRQASTRMFAPLYGIEEEAATGMAAGPLACYLYNLSYRRERHFEIEQGYMMHPPSPSLLNVTLQLNSGGDITGLMAGGRALVSETRAVDLV